MRYGQHPYYQTPKQEQHEAGRADYRRRQLRKAVLAVLKEREAVTRT